MREGILDREGVLMGNRAKDLAGIVSAPGRGAERPVERLVHFVLGKDMSDIGSPRVTSKFRV